LAETTNPQIVAFSNTRVRPLADELFKAYNLITAFVAEYNAQGIGALITAAGASQIIADGSLTDGRSRITGGDIFLLKTYADDLKFMMEQDITATPGDGKRTALVAKVEVHGLG
jgi:hypothetical protein